MKICYEKGGLCRHLIIFYNATITLDTIVEFYA